jgi:DNA-binding protein HU-beta
MRKTELIDEIARETKANKSIVGDILEAFMKSVKKHIASKENITLRGFGSFGLKRRAAKIGRNVTKNEIVKIPAHFIPVFKPSKKFKYKVKKILLD